MSLSTGLNAEETARTYPIAKQIMLGRWVLLEPAVYLLFLLFTLAMITLCVGAHARPDSIQKNEKQSFYAH